MNEKSTACRFCNGNAETLTGLHRQVIHNAQRTKKIRFIKNRIFNIVDLNIL